MGLGEVVTYGHESLALDLLRMKTTCTLQNNEYLSRRPAPQGA